MDGKTSDELDTISTQKSLSSHHEPGWNDPPKWAFSPTPGTTNSPSTKRLLNKRVAFPLSPGSPKVSVEQTSTGLTSNLPPPVQPTHLTSAPHKPLLAPSGNLESSQQSDSQFDKDRALQETLKNLETVMNKEIVASEKIEEVKKRLDTLKIMWKEEKLKEDICEKVLKISQALQANDAEAADKIHVSLMMENAAICNTWISGIRHIILELREKSSKADSVESSDAHPYLLPQ